MTRRPFPVPVRARYAETDQMGVVHHAAYPVWFEVARSELARAVGLAYAEWERRGLLLMVTDLECRYRRPARYDEEVIVWVWVSDVASRRVVFDYRVTGADGSVLAEGRTRHLTVDRASGKPTVLTEELRDSLGRDPAAGPAAPGASSD